MSFRNRNLCRLVALLLMCGAGPVWAGFLDDQTPRARQLGGYQEQYRELAGNYAARLKELAELAERSGFAEEAKSIRALAVPFDPAKIQSDSLPKTVQPDLPVTLPEGERWRLELRKLREDYANNLYLLSRQLLHAEFPSAAYRLVREVTAANPDHRFARRILGFQRLGEKWVTPFEAQQDRKRMVWHDKFGWLPTAHVKRYEAGERFYKRWMSAEQEVEIRRNFQHAWEIRTEHFLVKTNHSLERGVEVAKKLEEYHDFFVQTLPGFFYSPDQLKQLFNSASISRSRRQDQPFVVHYYRTREEYNQELIARVPQVAITNGLYHNGARIAYFYHDPEHNNDSTLYHEATHQLLYETRFDPRNQQGVGEDANFWIIEGIACYMESLKQKNGQMTLGDPEFVRFYWARNRYLGNGFYLPLARFASMGMKPFQHQSAEELSWSYSQASGLVHFFMHAEGGAYRDALIEHLSQIYQPNRRLAVQTLSELTGVSFAELDRQYGEYLRAQQRAVDNRQPLAPVEN